MSFFKIDEGDINSLHSEYDCEIIPSDVTAKKQVLTIVFKKTLKLQLSFDEDKELTVTILEPGVFQSTFAKELEDKMNRYFNKACNQTSLTNHLRYVLEVLKYSWKQGLSVEQTTTNTDIPTTSKRSLSGKDEISTGSKASKKIVLAANFTTPLANTSHAKKISSTHTAAKMSKKPPMKTAEDVINRIKWDSSLERDKFTVGYMDRFTGIVEKGFSEFDWENDIASVGPEVLSVPQHRIHYFKYGDRIVWNKDDRLDDVFGSTGGKHIHDVIELYQLSLHEKRQKEKNDELDQLNADSLLPSKLIDQEEPGNLSVELPRSSLQLEKSTKGRHSRPNCFIGFRVNDSEVAMNVSTYLKWLKQGISASQPHDHKMFSQATTLLEKLHVTLCVCCLKTDEDIEKVKQVLTQTCDNSDGLSVAIRGVGNFGENVVYANIHSKHILSLQKKLMQELAEQNIDLSGNFKPYHPHMTLVKLSKKNQNLYKKYEKFIHGKKSKRYQFKKGFFAVNSILLCEMKTSSEDKFYKVIASSPIINTQDDAVSGRRDSFHPSDHERKHSKPRKSTGFPSQHDHEDSVKHQRKYDIRLGKALSAVLRHNKFGFRIDSDGYVLIEAILNHQHFHNMRATKEDIYRVVENNEKKRFTISRDEHGVERIKANQGHSVEVDDPTLTEITDPSLHPLVIHGTFWAAWKSIKKEGLHRRKRIHIHMTTAEPSDSSHVISGMRKSCTVYIYVDMAAALKDGIKFYLSTNGVILTRGDDDGFLKPKYFAQVIGISDGKRCTVDDDFVPPSPPPSKKKRRRENKTKYQSLKHEESAEIAKDSKPSHPQSSSTTNNNNFASTSEIQGSIMPLLVTESSEEDSTAEKSSDSEESATVEEEGTSKSVSSSSSNTFQTSEDTSKDTTETTETASEDSSEQDVAPQHKDNLGKQK